jgi:hypothetical protein
MKEVSDPDVALYDPDNLQTMSANQEGLLLNNAITVEWPAPQHDLRQENLVDSVNRLLNVIAFNTRTHLTGRLNNSKKATWADEFDCHQETDSFPTPISHVYAFNFSDPVFLTCQRHLSRQMHRKTFNNPDSLVEFLLRLKASRSLFRLKMRSEHGAGCEGIRHGCLIFDSTKSRLLIHGYHWVSNAQLTEFEIINLQRLCDFFLKAESSRFAILCSFSVTDQVKLRAFQDRCTKAQEKVGSPSTLQLGHNLYHTLKRNIQVSAILSKRKVPKQSDTILSEHARGKQTALNKRDSKAEDKLKRDILTRPDLFDQIQNMVLTPRERQLWQLCSQAHQRYRGRPEGVILPLQNEEHEQL